MKFLSASRPFWLNLFLIIGAVTLLGILGYLLFQDAGILSNIYFLGAFALWIVAVIPAFIEIGSSLKIRSDARKRGKDAKLMLHAAEQKFQEGGQITFLFGLSGFICFILAFVTLAL